MILRDGREAAVAFQKEFEPVAEGKISRGEGPHTRPGVSDLGNGRYQSFEIAGLPIFWKSSGNSNKIWSGVTSLLAQRGPNVNGDLWMRTGSHCY